MKDVTFTFDGSKDQVLELFDLLRKSKVFCYLKKKKKPKTLVIPVREISVEEADAILKDY